MAVRRRPQGWSRMWLWLLAVFVAVMLLAHGWSGWREAVEHLLALYGWPFFFIFTLFYNVLVVPFPYDPFLAVAPELVPGHGFWAWWGLATAGMGLAAVLAYTLARYAVGPKLREWLMRRKAYRKVARALEKHGYWAVGLSTFTPLPFSLVCWVSGLLGIPVRGVMLCAVLGRGVRNALVLWLAGSF